MIGEPNWPVSVLASPHWRAQYPQRQAMAICVGYFEGNDSRYTTGRFTVAGFVAAKTRWRFFEDRWTRALHAEGLNRFSGRDFQSGAGEFSEWKHDADRRTRLIEALSRVVEQQVMAGFSYSIRDDDYEDLNHAFQFAEKVSGPYGVCAAFVMARVRQWMATRHPNDQTLFVFEDGDLDHREIRRVLSATGIDQGEPPQVWPRRWKDEQGRPRVLRPFEACDLLLPVCKSRLGDLLSARGVFECEAIGPAALTRICETAGIARRSRPGHHEVVS
jgi:hypothetical protein